MRRTKGVEPSYGPGERGLRANHGHPMRPRVVDGAILAGMDDERLTERINDLSDEEEQLYERASHSGGLTPEGQERLGRIAAEIDQTQDLLNQRAARRDAGLDPEGAQERPPEVVEGYEQ